MQCVFSEDDFRPGEVKSNYLELDPQKPWAEQLSVLVEDMVWVEYPNGCQLGIDWMPPRDIEGEFVVAVRRNPDSATPFFERRCRSIGELRILVNEAVEAAKGATGEYVISGYHQLGADDVEVNDLVLDPRLPLERQVAVLRENLFEAAFQEGYVLTIGWDPAHDPRGHFVIALKRASGEWRPDPECDPRLFFRHRNPESWRLLLEKRSRSIQELQAIAKEFAEIGKRGSQSDFADEP